MSNKHLTTTQFKQFELPDQLIKALDETGFTYCTPIQEKTLPLTLAGKDVSGQAQTGTGKTVSFLLALFNRLITHPSPGPDKLRALVIAPTRELAYQIYQDAVILNKFLDFRIGLAYGGKDYQKQRSIIESGIDILIGTPGRILDYHKQKTFSLDAIEVMVLDEADRMFDLGFIKDIRFVFRRLPPADKRLSMLFSATFTYRVHELAYEHMNNPESIKIEGENVTAEQIKESVYYPSMDEKLGLLIFLLNQSKETRSLVFVNTKYTGDIIHRGLEANDFKVGLLSGDIHQSKREKLLDAFKKGDVNVLVATDVAARGLHIPDVMHVFNYDLPQDSEDYVHRVGRTARAGAEGEAISFACEQYAVNLPDIEEFIDHKIPSATVPHDELPEYVKPKQRRSSDKRSRDKRPSAKRSMDKNAERPKKDSTRKESSRKKPAQKPDTQVAEQTSQIAKANKNDVSLQDQMPDNNIEAQASISSPAVVAPAANTRQYSKRGHEIPALG